MPHFDARKLVIMTRDTVPAGLTLEEVFEAMKEKQFPIRFKKGAVSYEIGMLINSYLGRDSIVADIGLDPEFTLILDKETIEVEGDDDKEITVVKYLEWTS